MVVLKGIIHDDVYDHLMHLSMAITLLNDVRRNGSLAYSRVPLHNFVEIAERHYEPFVVYNIHGV